MKTQFVLSAVTVVALALSVGVFAFSVQPATAGHEENAGPGPVDTEGGTAKVLIFGAMPGEIIAVHQGRGSFEDAAPSGLMLSAQPAPLDGKPLEVFVPVQTTSSVWRWSGENGYTFLANVAPLAADDNRLLYVE